MERISLPTRTITTRGAIAIPVGAALGVVLLLWAAGVVALWAPRGVWLKEFRQVLYTRTDIVRTMQGKVVSRKSLFGGSGGTVTALEPKALRATEADSWDGASRYDYARAWWRRSNEATSEAAREKAEAARRQNEGATDLAEAALKRSEAAKKRSDDCARTALSYMEAAVRCEPMNAFYRQTYAEALASPINAAKSRDDVPKLLADAPQDAWGQMRAAEILASRSGDPAVVRKHNLRALEIVSSDITSGLRFRAEEEDPNNANPSPLGPMIAKRVIGNLLKQGPYRTWGLAPDFAALPPEAHALAAAALSDLAQVKEAEQERDAIVAAVRERLAVQGQVSTRRTLYEILNPFARPDYTKRFLMGREITMAASVLRGKGQADEAFKILRELVKRAPTDASARVDLATALIEQAQALAREAVALRDAKNDAQALDRQTKANALYAEAREQVSALELIDPDSKAVVDLRAKLPSVESAGMP
jgi:hypothetical protein